jgi:hypothetical protein
MPRSVTTLDPSGRIVIWACRNRLGGDAQWQASVRALSRRIEPAQAQRD